MPTSVLGRVSVTIVTDTAASDNPFPLIRAEVRRPAITVDDGILSALSRRSPKAGRWIAQSQWIAEPNTGRYQAAFGLQHPHPTLIHGLATEATGAVRCFLGLCESGVAGLRPLPPHSKLGGTPTSAVAEARNEPATPLSGPSSGHR